MIIFSQKFLVFVQQLLANAGILHASSLWNVIIAQANTCTFLPFLCITCIIWLILLNNEDYKLTRLKVLEYDWKLMQPDQVWLQQQSLKSMQVWTLRKLTSKWRRILLPVGKSRTVPVCSLWIPDYWSLSASLVGVYSPAEGPLYHRKHKTTLFC